MKITWNGTGSAWSTIYGNASAVLEADGHRLLMDCGHTAPARLRTMGLSLRDINAGFISHLHGDHVYGLEEWGFRNYLMWQTRPPLLVPSDLARTLWDGVLAGTMDQLRPDSCRLEDFFEVIHMHVGQTYRLGPWSLEIHPVRHVPFATAYGLKVTQGDRSVGFTCDTLADADPWFYEGTEMVFHDCSFKPHTRRTVHAHFEELCGYPESLRGKTWLVHYDDDVERQREDPEWRRVLECSRMRLTEPYLPFDV